MKVRPIQILGPDAPRDRWLAARRTGIGASEIAMVLGLAPGDWGSPFSLYWRKKLGTVAEMNEAMEWGHRHETTIAEKFFDQHQEFYEKRAGLYRHPDHAWMLATPDRIAQPLDFGPPELVQIKTGYSWDGWGDPGTDQIPIYYRVQVQQEMAVYGARRCWVPVLVGGNSYREYVVDYDQGDVDTIVAAGEAFMALLDAGTPPAIDGSAATTSTLRELHPSVIDEPVTIPLELADRYAQRRALLADAKAAYEETSNQVLALIGDCRSAVADGRKVATRSVSDVTRLDVAAIRRDHPDLAEQYTVTSTVARLMPAKEAK